MPRKPAPPVPPATMPADAIGFVARRPDRPERLALFLRNGALNSTFAIDEGFDEIRAALAPQGLRLLDDGSVVR